MSTSERTSEIGRASFDELLGKHLCFSLGSERFALTLLQVKEVIGCPEITPIPQAPAHFKGLINLRGEVIPVIDLRIKLKVGSPQMNSETTIIILDCLSTAIGVVVDSVDCVSDYTAKDVSGPPQVGSQFNASYIKGVARSNENLTLIVDLSKTIAPSDQSVIEKQMKKAS